MSDKTRVSSPAPEPAEHWIEEVSSRSNLPVANVKEVLNRYNITPARTLPPRRRLSLKAVHFAGIKDLAVDGNPDQREYTPFSLTQELASGLTAFGTRNQNDAGKTSLLEVITWGIRGRCGLQKDVRRWIRQAAVEISLAGDRIFIGWTVSNGRPNGRVILCDENFQIDWDRINSQALICFTDVVDQGMTGGDRQENSIHHDFRDEATMEQQPLVRYTSALREAGCIELGEFDGDTEFEAVIGGLMLERLGFQSLPQWQRAPAASRIDDTDGTVSENGWAAWSQALIITNPAIKVPLGEEKFIASRLLQVYLGTAWAAPAAVAAARKSQLESRLGTLRRRAAGVDEAQTTSVRLLEEEARDLTERLALIAEPNAVEMADRLLDEIAEAAREYAAAQESHVVAATNYGAMAKLLESAEADEYAIAQAAVTKRFWHSLKPSCCPRCDATVSERQWQRELEGHCSLCNADVDLSSGNVGTDGQHEPLSVQDAARLVNDGAELDLEELDDLSVLRLQIAQLETRLLAQESAMDVAKAARDSTRARLEAARQAGGAVTVEAVRERRNLELALARVQGQLIERAQPRGDGPDAPIFRETQEALAVVTAASEVAKQRRDADQAQMLIEVSTLVTDLGRRLGIAQLEQVTLRGNLHMPVVKGGQSHTFGSLTEGEVLRLKIALVIALLRVGTSAGVGRYPGLLLIDSLGREELNPEDLAIMLQELRQIALDAQLQIVATSAYGDILEHVLPSDSLRLAGVGERMW